MEDVVSDGASGLGVQRRGCADSQEAPRREAAEYLTPGCPKDEREELTEENESL